jgi:hypothetical protein
MLDGTSASADLLRTLAQQHTARCIERLVEVLNGEDPMAAVEAARELLARAYGQPSLALGMPNLTMIVRAPTDPEAARANSEARAWDA